VIWFKANLVFLVVTIMAAIGLYVSWIPGLPAEIPIHFDENMVPDDVVSSSEFLWIFIFSQLAALLVFVGLSFGIRYIPVSLVNLPNREYWLTGERRADSLSWLSGMLMLMASSVMWLMIGLFRMSVQFGRGDLQNPGPVLWTMVIMFLAVCAGVIIYSLFRFKKPV